MALDLKVGAKKQPDKQYVSELYSRPKLGKLRRKIGKFAEKNQTWIIAIAASIYMDLKVVVYKAGAQGIFKPAQDAMSCVVTQAATGGAATALFTNLPFIVFTLLTLAVFVYFVYTIVQAISSYGNGQEVTHIVQQPMFTLFCVILVFVLESVLFGASGGCA